MDVIVTAVLAGVAGLVVGALLVLRRGRGPRPRPADTVVDVLHVGALVVDRHDTVVLCNPAARAMGLVRGDELALNELRDLARDARRADAIYESEVRLLHGWLPREPAAVRAYAAPAGRGGQIALLVEDITEARRVEDMRRDFVANVSHELKTPVGAISLLAEALDHASDDPQAVHRFTDRMRHESGRLTRLVAELIELSRLEAADRRAEVATVPIRQVISEAVDRTRLAASAQHITVAGSHDAETAVLGSREQLVSAVVNLLDNAVAYSPEHTEVTVTARHGPTSSTPTVEITVTDQGIGIADEDLDRVFERFYRADPARSRATGGTGLGLAIVKHIAANHGGSVRVTSRVGRGSAFTLILPAIVAGSDQVSTVAALTAGTAG